VTIKVNIAYPPHRDAAVAEFHVARDGKIDIPAELFRSDGHLMIALYSRESGIAWEYRVSDLLAAIALGIEVLEGQ